MRGSAANLLHTVESQLHSKFLVSNMSMMPTLLWLLSQWHAGNLVTGPARRGQPATRWATCQWLQKAAFFAGSWVALWHYGLATHCQLLNHCRNNREIARLVQLLPVAAA